MDGAPDVAERAAALGVSREAVELHFQSDVIDLHIDSFIWHRIFGYDLTKRHTAGPFPGVFGRQVDLPRLREAGVTGATWVITTNPFRGKDDRAHTFVRNLEGLRRVFDSAPEHVTFVRNVAEYRAARALGRHAAFIGIQGGNALDRNPDGSALDLIPDDAVLRVTLVHLTNSSLGVTSSPLSALTRSDGGLTAAGRAYVHALNRKKIFVDLAHIHRRGFFDALAVHDRSQPVLVTHTGVSGVTPHWRNLDDEQLRAVADLGGTIGVMYESSFLGDSRFHGKISSVLRHLAHIVDTVGEDHASLGSDWDGMIVTPRDMPTCSELPRLTQAMLDHGWKPERIQKILGGNFLRVVEALRG
jgi:membrane dipeptidase